MATPKAQAFPLEEKILKVEYSYNCSDSLISPPNGEKKRKKKRKSWNPEQENLREKETKTHPQTDQEHIKFLEHKMIKQHLVHVQKSELTSK